MRKIIDLISVISFLLIVSTLGAGTYTFFWLKGNQDKLQEIIIEKVKDQLPIPKLGGATGPALPMKGGLPF